MLSVLINLYLAVLPRWYWGNRMIAPVPVGQQTYDSPGANDVTQKNMGKLGQC